MKRFGALLVATGVVFSANPAAADPAGPTDYQSEIVDIEPATTAVEASMLGGDSFLLLEVEPGTEVLVLGYEAEPYLRFLSDGTVEQNLNSPSHYLNTDRYGEEDIPEFADADAEPNWDKVDSDGTWAWHDHRTHWMPRSDPLGSERGNQVLEAVVPLFVDGVEVDMTVSSVWQDEPSRLPILVGALTGVILAVLAGLAVGSVARGALLAAALAVMALVVGLAQNWSLPPETGPSRLNWLLPLTGLVLLGAATALRNLDGLVRWALVAAGSAELTLWGWLRRDGLGAAILPTDLPFWIDRLVTALALAGGVGLTGVAVYAVARPPAHQAAS
ncbi:MAG: hypothetical protein GY745_05295 [Actinomycetia bacterium]|nr:hypothetical protein [Actinomycetes bacterium]MCP4084452.1 hypothetical protein [Actinomycetes bacterium]